MVIEPLTLWLQWVTGDKDLIPALSASAHSACVSPCRRQVWRCCFLDTEAQMTQRPQRRADRSLTTAKPHAHKRSSAHKEQQRCVRFHKKALRQVDVTVQSVAKVAEWENICAEARLRAPPLHLRLTWRPVVSLLCFALVPQLQPGQVHGCYLNDVLILVKQFCVWLNRGSVSQESQY